MPIQNCGAQYVEYTIKNIYDRLYEHKTSMKANYEAIVAHTLIMHLPFKLDEQILTQAPSNEPNLELWLKQKEYYILDM
jgi:hypothetical protein